MGNWTKLDEARQKFLDAAFRACQAFADRTVTGDDLLALRAEESRTWYIYRDLLDGREENAELDKARWFCPHCGKDRPQFNFQLVGNVVFGIGALQYFNIFCGEESCRKLLSVAMIGYAPEAGLIAEAQKIAGSRIHKV